MTLPLSRIDELERLVEKMTPGLWRNIDGNWNVFASNGDNVASCSDWRGPERAASNGAGIVALRNSAQELLATARGAEELAKTVERLRAATDVGDWRSSTVQDTSWHITIDQNTELDAACVAVDAALSAFRAGRRTQ